MDILAFKNVVIRRPTVSSLGPTFGRGAMTNGWIDIKNSDMMLIMGGNPAENHPCGSNGRLKPSFSGTQR